MRRPDAAATDRNASASTVAGAGVPSYVGRFAPSPTGPLHFGSLIAAMASYADAKSTDGRWLLRIEDLDPPRESPAAAASFPATLEHFGFEWDGPILYQSTREDAYAAALAALIRAGDAFACACTRAELAAAAAGQHQDSGEPVYPVTCRRALPAGRAGRAWRARVDASPVTFVDRIQETLSQNLPQVIARVDKMTKTLSENLPDLVDRAGKASEVVAELAEDIRQLKELAGVTASARDKSLVTYANGLLAAVESSNGTIGVKKTVGKGLKNTRPATEWVVGARREALVLTILVKSKKEMLTRLGKTKLGANWMIEFPDQEPMTLIDWLRQNHAESKEAG